jgi:hypothetical protein
MPTTITPEGTSMYPDPNTALLLWRLHRHEEDQRRARPKPPRKRTRLDLARWSPARRARVAMDRQLRSARVGKAARP